MAWQDTSRSGSRTAPSSPTRSSSPGTRSAHPMSRPAAPTARRPAGPTRSTRRPRYTLPCTGSGRRGHRVRVPGRCRAVRRGHGTQRTHDLAGRHRVRSGRRLGRAHRAGAPSAQASRVVSRRATTAGHLPPSQLAAAVGSHGSADPRHPSRVPRRPDEGFDSPVNMRSSVDLPEPDGPSSANNLSRRHTEIGGRDHFNTIAIRLRIVLFDRTSFDDGVGQRGLSSSMWFIQSRGSCE